MMLQCNMWYIYGGQSVKETLGQTEKRDWDGNRERMEEDQQIIHRQLCTCI